MSSRKSSTPPPDLSTEATPLLRSNPPDSLVGYTLDPSPPADPVDAPRNTGAPSRLGLIVLLLLCLSAISVLLLGLFAPSAAAHYAKEAVALDLTSLSIDSFTKNGLKVRIQATAQIDASRVKRRVIRTLGRTGAWIINQISTDATKIDVYLPDYDGGHLGTISVPLMTIFARNGQITKMDFVSDVKLGSRDTIRSLANDYLVGRLGKIRVLGVADLGLKSGLLHLGTQKISEEMAFEGSIYKQ